MATWMLTYKVDATACWTCTLLGIIIDYSNLEVGTLIGHLIDCSCSTCGTSFNCVVLATYLSFLPKINGLGPLILE